MTAPHRYIVLGAGGVGSAIGGMLQQRAGAPRGGGSTWQSLSRGTGTIETAYLNGEIARMGEQHGVPTPLNRALTTLAQRAAAEHWAPGHLSADDLAAALDRPEEGCSSTREEERRD